MANSPVEPVPSVPNLLARAQDISKALEDLDALTDWMEDTAEYLPTSDDEMWRVKRTCSILRGWVRHVRVNEVALRGRRI